jgi:hypothetical protein
VSDTLYEDAKPTLRGSIHVVRCATAISSDRTNDDQSAPSLTLKNISRGQTPSSGTGEVGGEDALCLSEARLGELLVAKEAISEQHDIDTAELGSHLAQRLFGVHAREVSHECIDSGPA